MFLCKHSFNIASNVRIGSELAACDGNSSVNESEKEEKCSFLTMNRNVIGTCQAINYQEHMKE